MPAAPLVTLFSDYGGKDGFEAAVVGRLLGSCPQARIYSLSQDAGFPLYGPQAAFRWRRLWPHFPPGSVHCCCLDPQGKGDIYLAVAAEQMLFGLNCELMQAAIPYGVQAEWYRLALPPDQASSAATVSTFRARDYLAPHLGAILQAGCLPAHCQPMTGRPGWPHLQVLNADRVIGTVIDGDSFGNIITNVVALNQGGLESWHVRLGSHHLRMEYGTFADSTGLHARAGCDDQVIIAINQDSAWQRLDCSLGQQVSFARSDVMRQGGQAHNPSMGWVSSKTL